MTLDAFLARAPHDRDCPPGVHPARWRAMLAWRAARAALGEPAVYADEPADTPFLGTRPARALWPWLR